MELSTANCPGGFWIWGIICGSSIISGCLTPPVPSSFRLPIPNLGELDVIHPFSKYLVRVSFVPYQLQGHAWGKQASIPKSGPTILSWVWWGRRLPDGNTKEGLVYYQQRGMRFLGGSRNQILKSNAIKPGTDSQLLPLGLSCPLLRGAVLALSVAS